MDRGWPVNNLWVGNQGQIGLPSTNPRIYNLQQSDVDRGNTNHSLHVPHNLGFTQSTLGSEFAKSQLQNQQSNLNGYMYGHQVYQTRQNEENFLGADTKSDRHDQTLRGLSTYESEQGTGPDNHMKTSARSETSESPVNYDFFGSQQQTGGQQPGMLQSLPPQQTVLSEFHQLQQELMFRKLQEHQRQLQLRQIDPRQQDSVNQISSFGRMVSGNKSNAFTNATPISDISTYPSAMGLTVGSTNLLQHTSPPIERSSSGLVFSSEQGQASHSKVDPYIYGVPISGSRGSFNKYSHIATDKPSMQQFASSSNSSPRSQYATYQDQNSMQDGTSNQGFQGKDLFGHASDQGLDGRLNMDNLQLVNSLQISAPVQEFPRRQELDVQSETQVKTTPQVSPSQNEVALDPTEQKILFGSDDNIWDAFGTSSNPTGSTFNLLDGMNSLNGFPSVQSGSWSALMQSAVAETSSSNIGTQEEWSNLSFQKNEILANHEPSSDNDGGKQHKFLNDKSLQIGPEQSSGSVPLYNNTSMNNNYQNALGFQRFGQKHSYEHGQRLQTSSSQTPSQQSPEGGNSWFNHVGKPHAVERQDLKNSSRLLNEEAHAKSIPGPWTPRQSGSSQPCDKPNGWNVASLSRSGSAALSNHERENSFQHSQSYDHKRATYEERDQGGGLLKVNSVPYSTAGSGHVKSTVESPQANRDNSSLSGAVAFSNSGSTRVDEETNQLLPNSGYHNYWKHVDSLVKSKDENMEKSYQQNRPPQGLGLNSFDKEEVKVHEMDNCNKKENSSDSYHSNLSHHSSAGGLRETVLSDATDSRMLPGGKQKSSNQVGRSSGLRKFQYHPMGNMDEDVESTHGPGLASHPQAMFQQNFRELRSQDQGYIGQSKVSGQVTKTQDGMGKLPDRQGDTRVSDVVPSGGSLTNYAPNTSTFFDRSGSVNALNVTSQSSKNMLELFQEVDQSMKHSTAMHLSSSEHDPSSNRPEAENSDGSAGHRQNSHFSSSQGFGLQLGPPSQRLPVDNRAFSSKSSAQAVNNSSSIHSFPDIRDKGHMQLPSTTSFQSLSAFHEPSRGESRRDRISMPGQTVADASQNRMPGNFPSPANSGLPYTRNRLQNQQITGRQVLTNQSLNISAERHTPFSRHPDDSRIVLEGQSALPTLSSGAPGVSKDNTASSRDTLQRARSNHQQLLGPDRGALSKLLPNPWTNVPAHQSVLDSQAHKIPLNFSRSHQSNTVEATSAAPQSLESQEVKEGRNTPPDSGASSVRSQGILCEEEQNQNESLSQKVSSANFDLDQMTSESQGKESVIKHLSNGLPANAPSSQREIEAFGRSLKPNNFYQQKFSLLNQIQAMKNAETDLSNRDSKRLKGSESDNSPGAQQVALKPLQSNERNAVAGDASDCQSAVLSGDCKMPRKTGPVNLEKNVSSQFGNMPSKDELEYGLNDPQSYRHSNDTTGVRLEHPKISPQMAPSWFNQYGTFKTGQMLPMFDAQKVAALKTLEQPLAFAKSSNVVNSLAQMNDAADTSQIDDIRQSSSPSSAAMKPISSPQLLPPDVSGKHLVAVRPKKRKTATSELHPWHKEVSQGSQSLQTHSIAEADWARAAKRRAEKVGDEAEVIDDGQPMLRPKRRLILTTKLMQQLFRPPPGAFLSVDASSNYDSVTYFVTREALVDACSLVSCSQGDLDVQASGKHLLCNEQNQSGRIDDQRLLKVVEDNLARAKQVEDDFLRLDRRASILDVRLECQDIEKFSVINRFAKFHGRGQADTPDPSSSSDAIAQKPLPQRYVTALPMPRNLPDRVQCLSL